MAFAAMLVGSATAFNAGAPFRTPGPRPVVSRSGAVTAHDTSVLEKTSETMDARLDPQVAQGPFGKGGSLEWLAKLTDAWAELALAQRHAFDDKEVPDSSKNLQVLWSRAVLAKLGELDDPIAYELLPEATRGRTRAVRSGAPRWCHQLIEAQENGRCISPFTNIPASLRVPLHLHRGKASSTLHTSPSSSSRRSGMPWQMTSFTDVQHDLGKPW